MYYTIVQVYKYDTFSIKLKHWPNLFLGAFSTYFGANSTYFEKYRKMLRIQM